MKLSLVILLLLAVLVSCYEKNSKNLTVKSEKKSKNSDTLKTESKTITTISKKNEKSENHIKIIEKFGEQWDFCTCVLANDSINSAFEKTTTDAETNKLMKRWEHVELKCKEFLTSENKTPEQRIAHELKVKKCLKNVSK